MTREEAIFAEALGKGSGTQRDAYLDAACAGDANLRRAVGALVLAHEGAAGILESPPVDLEATSDVAPALHGVGSTIGPYKLLEQIGGGGMGVVFMAEQVRPVRRKVALKIIKPGMDSGQVIARFEAERQALTMMDHPNIAKVLDAGTTDAGRPYFVMELVKGVPITDYCDQARLDPRQRLDLFVQVCNAVQHAHQKGVIHRDLKPGNVLVTLHDDKPVPKVIDFGIAKATGGQLTDRTLFTNYAQMLGTPLYMSPEQAQLSGLDVDTRSDVYSLGVLLYELLTGTTPFDKKRLREAAYDEMRRIIREEDPPKPSTRLSSMADRIASVSAQRHTEPKKLSRLVHGELDWIVMKSLEKDRTRRYETANGLARDVERYLHDETVHACPPSAGYRFRKFARRNKRPVLAAGLVAAALVGGMVTTTWQAVRARQAQSRAVAQAAKATAISDLLQEMLDSANPEAAKGTEYTVRKWLDDFSARLGDQLSNQPEAEAAVHATIGRAYRRLAAYESAEPHLRTALEQRRRILGSGHPDVAQSLVDMASYLRSTSKPAEAEILAREALAIYEHRGLDIGARLKAYVAVQLALRQQNKYADSDEISARALAAAAEAGIQDHPEVANILHVRGSLRTLMQDPVEGEKIGAQAVAMHRRVHGKEHIELAFALSDLIGALTAQGKYRDAEACGREALAIFRAQLDETNGNVSNAHGRLEAIFKANGDAVALAALRGDRAAGLAEAFERKPRDSRSGILLGKALTESGDLEGAVAHFSEVAATPDMAPGVKHSLADACSQLGRLLRDKQSLEQAERVMRRAIALREPLGDALPGVRLAQANNYNDLAFVLKPAKRLPEAEQAARAGLELKQGLVTEFPEKPEYRFHLAHSYLGLGYIKKELGRTPDAVQAVSEADVLLKALAADASVPEGVRTNVGHAQWQLGETWSRLSRSQEAEQAYQQALDTFQQLAVDYPASPFYRQEVGKSHWLLADVIEQDGRTPDAERHLLHALGCYEKLVAEVPGSTFFRQEQAFSHRKLASLTDRAGRADEAERHLREALGGYLKLVAEVPNPAFYREQAAHVHWLLADLMQRAGRWPEADAALRAVARLHPESADAKSGLAVLEAEAKAREAVRLQPEVAGVHRSLGDILRHRGNLAASMAAYLEAIRLKPDDAELQYAIGPIYAQLGRWAEAAAALQRGVELDPSDHMRWYLAAAARLAAGDTKGYRRACREMLERFGNTTDPYVAERTAKTCAIVPDADVDLQVVAKLAERAVTGTEKNEHYRFFVLAKGLAEYRAGRHAKSADWLGRYAPDPNGTHGDGMAFAALAMAQHQLRRAPEARAALSAAQEIISRKMPDPAKGRPFNGDWHEWLRFQVLIREAETVLAESALTP